MEGEKNNFFRNLDSDWAKSEPKCCKSDHMKIKEHLQETMQILFSSFSHLLFTMDLLLSGVYC